MRLKNKVVIITGASSGVGKAVAFEFSKKGAKVVLAARRVEKLKEIQSKIRQSGINQNKCFIIKTDITKEKEVQNLFSQTEKKYEAIDILINNVGKGLKSSIHKINYQEWISLMDTNLTSVFLSTREAVCHMLKKKSKGHIITISSIAGKFGAPNYSAYCASKHGVTGFKKSLRWELMAKQIKVSTIHPGRIDTEFFDSYKQKPSKAQMLSPKDIAQYVVAIAERSLLKKYYFKLRNLLKRNYNLIKYSLI